jgi:hypothetical protein
MTGEAAAGEEMRCSLCLTPWCFLVSNPGSRTKPGSAPAVFTHIPGSIPQSQEANLPADF